MPHLSTYPFGYADMSTQPSFALMVIVLLITSAFVVNLPLPLGVLGHEGSTVIVVLNGLITLLVWPEFQRRRKARTV